MATTTIRTTTPVAILAVVIVPALVVFVPAARAAPAAQAVAAPAAAPLSLDDCVRLAEAAPSPVNVAERQRAIASARATAARAGLLPRLAFSAGYNRNGPLGGPGQTGS